MLDAAVFEVLFLLVETREYGASHCGSLPCGRCKLTWSWTAQDIGCQFYLKYWVVMLDAAVFQILGDYMYVGCCSIGWLCWMLQYLKS
jgi:hypothetical protein